MSIAAVQPLTLNAGNSMTLMDGCTVNMHALWVRDKRGVNALTADSGVHDPYLFDACRDKSTVGWYSGPLKLGELGHEPRLPAPNSTRGTTPAPAIHRPFSSEPRERPATCSHDPADHFEQSNPLACTIPRVASM